MVIAIQKYLWVNRIKWDLVEGTDFLDVKTVLDNVMRERTEANIGVVPRHAEVITYEFEEKMWKEGILGEDTPDRLRNTVLFLIGINLMLRAVEEHYYLRRNTPSSTFQLSFHTDGNGNKCILYQEDCVTKTHDGGLNDMCRDRKEVWIFPNETNVNRCPVRLIQKYLSLCPKYYKKANFYLQSLLKPTPTQWYSGQVVGQNTLGKTIGKMMKEADIAGYFTNHSARHTGGTQLFNAGVDRKIVKECTGHTSDAIDKYQITSVEQKKQVSKILANKPTVKVVNSDVKMQESSKESVGNVPNIVSVTVPNDTKKEVCQCQMKQNDVGNMINSIIEKNKDKCKMVIKLEIELSHE